MTKRRAEAAVVSPEYKHGYDAGMNGANMVNCHFSIFSTPEKMRRWQIGNTDGRKDRVLARLAASRKGKR